MSDFTPTHEFRGLPLRYSHDYRTIDGTMVRWYRTENGSRACLSDNLVTKLQPKPKPGEVWKYTGGLLAEHRLELVTRYGTFVDVSGDTTEYEGYEDAYVKVLNADGSPA